MAHATSGDEPTLHTDVLVVGGGPAGASVATWLARSGHQVTLLEKHTLTSQKACGDALTPRAVRELQLLDVDPLALGGQRVAGVRMVHGTRAVTAPWPHHPDLPDHGVILRRDVLDQHLRSEASAAGATVLMGHEALAPIVERGFVRGATVAVTNELTESANKTREVRSRFLVIADGANSAFGRGLGTTRDHKWPYGVASRSYWSSPRSSESWIESTLGLADANGNSIAGYGWVMPVGDGAVNVGVATLSTYRDAKGINTLKLLDSFANNVAERWEIEPTQALATPTRFRVPLGGSVGPKMGPTFLVIGDAAGAANPFNGDGVDGALMCGRLAADVLDEALTSGNSTTLQRYPTLLEEAVGQYQKVGRLTARLIGSPTVLSPLLKLGMRSDRAMGAALRITANELRSNKRGGAERAYALASAISRFAPNW